MITATETPWHIRAACLGQDIGVFFIERANSDRYKAAVRICRTCPVRGDCLNDALTRERDLDVRHRYGVFGGLTPRQRTRVHRETTDA